MKFGHILSVTFSLAAHVLLSAASSAGAVEPDIFASATFPENNAFSQVVNGEKNKMMVTVENRSDRNITLLTISGTLHHPDTSAFLKNLTSLKYGVPLIEKGKIQLPYTFYSEFKPGEHVLKVWLDHADDDAHYRINAYEGIVTVVEPEVSVFDFKMISTYLVVASILGGLLYYAYLSVVPQKKGRGKRPSAASVSSPIGNVTASGAGGYQEEWIPEHHLKKGKGKRGGATSGTSGDELSSTEVASNKKTKKN